MCNINKKVKAIHRELDQYLEEVILADCEKISDLYFEMYKPKMNRVSEIIEEIYRIPKRMTTEEYDVYFYEYANIITEVQASNRTPMINEIVNQVFNESSKPTLDYMIEFLVRELVRIGVDRNRTSIEIQKANYRYLQNAKRFHQIKIDEIEEEFMAVMMFGQMSLLEFGRKYVDGFYDEEEEIEVEVIDYEESNQYIKMTSFNQVTDWLESQGYREVRVVGSHHIFKCGSHSVPVPLHKGKDFNKFLGYQIQREIKERSGM